MNVPWPAAGPVGPVGGLMLASDGNFYGTAFAGEFAAFKGGIYKIDAAGTLTTLHVFSRGDGMRPAAALIQGADGNLYGTATNEGPLGGGVVFRLSVGGSQ